MASLDNKMEELKKAHAEFCGSLIGLAKVLQEAATEFTNELKEDIALRLKKEKKK